MDKRLLNVSVLMGLLLSVLVIGCASQQALTVQPDPEPFRLQYDINYTDQSSVTLDLMVIPMVAVVPSRVMKDVDRAVDEVAREIPRSELLARQDIFRDELNTAFREISRHSSEVQLLVMGVAPSQVTVAMK